MVCWKGKIILKIVVEDLHLDEIEIMSIDWCKLVDILVEKRLMLFLYPKVRMYIVDKKIGCYDTIYKKLYQNIDRQICEIKSIQNKLNSHGIVAMFIKGIFLSETAYDNVYARQCSDIDILVNKEDMVSAYNSVYELGYRFLTGFDKNNVPILSEKPDYLFSEDYHEFPCLKEDSDGNFIEIEIKYATSAIRYRDIKDFWENFRISDSLGIEIRTFNTTFTLIHICAHLYVNTQCEDGYLNDVMLRDFVDLKMFLKCCGDINWKFIYKKAKEFEIIHQLYFALFSINSLWPNTVKAEILAYFSISNIAYDYSGNEFGELYNWQINIVTRCFNEKLRLKEYSTLYKKEIFSKKGTHLIMDDGKMHPFLLEKDTTQILLFISYNSFNDYIRLVTLFDSELFRENDLYFFITLVDNNMSQELIERNISNPKEVCYTNLKGTWETYMHNKQGINFITIKTENIFNSMCDKVHIVVDI